MNKTSTQPKAKAKVKAKNSATPAAKKPKADFWQGVDPEVAQFEKDLLESVGQMQRGEFASSHTPEQITARRAGRPVGSIKTSPKHPTTLRLDDDVLARWRASGKGWQTRAAQVLASNAP